MTDLYKKEIIDPGDLASQLAHKVCVKSYNNCPAVIVIPHQSENFRGPVGCLWRKHILSEMTRYKTDSAGNIISWRVSEEVESDGAGSKPQFLTLVGTPEVFRGLGKEIITMTADDFARSGRFPAIISTEINTKGITESNFALFKSMIEGYGEALKKSNLVNITGEIAIMQHSVSTAFRSRNPDDQLILNWGASCIGLAHHDLLINNLKIRSGMPIVGFLEPGYRCNGGTFFTNLILEKFGPDIESIKDSHEALEFIRKLTIPSQSYAKTIARIVGWKEDGRTGSPLANIAGIAHITGGGIWSKLGEILPRKVGAHLYSMPKPPAVLTEAQELSWDTELKLSDLQAYGTFHGGCGMFIIASTESDAATIIKEAKKDGIKTQIVGETTKSDHITIESQFKEGMSISSLKPQ